MEIPIHAEVHCSDGPVGHLTRIILKPETDEVTDIVVRSRGIVGVERLATLAYIIGSTPDSVTLSCSKAKFETLPPFLEEEYVPAETSGYRGPVYMWPYYMAEELPPIELERQNIPEDELAITRGMRVQAADGDVGHVDELVTDTRGRISYLVLRHGHLWAAHTVAIPLNQIARVDEAAVYLKLDKAAVAALAAVNS